MKKPRRVTGQKQKWRVFLQYNRITNTKKEKLNMSKNEEIFLGKNLSESELFCQNSIWKLVEKSAKDFDISPNRMMQIMMDISIGVCVMCDDPRALLRALIVDFENFEASPEIERMVQYVKNEREHYKKYKDGEYVD